MTFHRSSGSVILRIENYTAGRRAKRNWQECWHHASSKTYFWLSKMKQRGNRKKETIIYTVFSPRKVGLQSMFGCTGFFSSTIQLWQMLTLRALFLAKWNLCQACADFFSCPCLFGIVVIRCELHCAEVCQGQSSDTVQFWCQPSPGLALSSHGRVVSLLYFKL